MRHLRRALSKDGYVVENIGYPSTKQSIEELADYLEEKLQSCCAPEEGRLHFVTHSMGGILVRYYTATRDVPNLGRVVMLSPPNGGSELIDAWRKIPVVRNGIGPSRGQLGTDPSSLPQRLGPVEFDVGIIAGDKSLNPIYSWLIPGKDDGKVSVERAKVSGMTDFIVVPHSHTFIMKSEAAIEQTRHFLREGSFDHGEAPAADEDALWIPHGSAE
jgi:pimeloyl-ACP methyl ester carboxylesterase